MKAFLESLNLFSPEEIETCLSLGQLKTFKKEDFFIQQGKVAKEAGFLQSGIFRSFYYSDEGEDVTYCFRFPQQWVGAYSSYITGLPTLENLQAITPATVFVLPKYELEQRFQHQNNWLRFSKMVAENEYVELEKRVLTLQREKAEVKYARLLEEHPDYLLQIPLQYIASYLGISQRHLSRIRRAYSL